MEPSMDFEEQITARMAKVEQELAVIKSNYATKADVLEAKNSIIMWVISAVFLAQVLPALLKQFGQ
ncbi:hypothetical protein E4O92_02180 [Massilia horti]|uniref:Uncharacterized protein n=2 Tax=Massilia horti TaxID=2562153 RepID=A0A4Y9T7N6_9BURK|nr:hypothetical protein E4O92_02180 [Massilia horti]